MHNLLKQSLAGLRVLLVLTVLTGVLYPLAVWGVGRLPGLQANAEGSIITRNGQAVGSALIGVDPVPSDPADDPWFHTRPSAGSKDPLGPGDPSTSGASNKAATNPDLDAVVAQRRTLVARREGVAEDRVPQDAVTASASGLDPHISPAYAGLQAARVAEVTGVPLDTVRALVVENTSRGVGEPAVNVLELNLAVEVAGGRAVPSTR